MNTDRTLKATLWTLAAFTFVLIVWGGVVRRSGSGLGCPDWPLCYDQWVPPFEVAALIEFTHRFLAGMTGLLAVTVAFLVLRRGDVRKRLWSNVTLLLILLLLQVLLGGVTVKSELHGTVVAAHLALAFAFFGVVISLLRNIPSPLFRGEGQGEGKIIYWLVIAALFLQITLGGLVSGYQAGLACPDFPTCQGLWLPVLKGPVALQFVHRLGALVAGLLTVVYGLSLSGQRRIIVIALVATQVALGIGNVMMGLAFAMDIAHLAVATILFGAVIAFRIPLSPMLASRLCGGGRGQG